jgi:flavin reductase (DIM6/NTAB) family NADH-FMN oxidoreductase RutF
MRAARRRWASGVTAVTTVEGEGDAAAFRGTTVSAFTVVSLEPPLVLIALEQGGRLAAAVAESGRFAVSVLDRAQGSLADRFAGYGPLPDVRFTGIPFETAATGCPILLGSLAWFDCRVATAHGAGDHLLLLGAVEAAGLGEATDDPLLNFDGGYRRLEGG